MAKNIWTNILAFSILFLLKSIISVLSKLDNCLIPVGDKFLLCKRDFSSIFQEIFQVFNSILYLLWLKDKLTDIVSRTEYISSKKKVKMETYLIIPEFLLDQLKAEAAGAFSFEPLYSRYVYFFNTNYRTQNQLQLKYLCVKNLNVTNTLPFLVWCNSPSIFN